MKVLNKRTDIIPPDAVYVGRPSKWGNPFQIGRDGTREEVIEKFRVYVEGRLAAKWNQDGHPSLRGINTKEDLGELRGKDLVCWCAPLPCHADVLLEMANEEEHLD